MEVRAVYQLSSHKICVYPCVILLLAIRSFSSHVKIFNVSVFFCFAC